MKMTALRSFHFSKIGKGLVLPLVFALYLLTVGSLSGALAGGRQPPEVVICATHDRALVHWLKAAEKGTLPKSKVAVLHYDAHPDMGVPHCFIPRGWPADIDRLMACVDIAGFQLAAVRAGLVDRIVWLRPPWAEQFADGTYPLHLGEDAGGRLKVDVADDYYLFDGTWAPAGTLRNTDRIVFEVMPYDALPAGHPVFTGPLILDIDLDIFSTRNPGVDFLRKAGLPDAAIYDIAGRFSPENLWLSRNPETRRQEIDGLKAAVADLLDGPWPAALAALPVLFRRGVGPLDLYRLYQAFGRIRTDVAVEDVIENFEMAIGIPEHLSSEKEIRQVLTALGKALSAGIVKPDLVTIARSVEGGFTPPEVCKRVEKEVLRILRNTLGNVTLAHDRAILEDAG